MYGIGFINGKRLSYLYHDVSYEIYSSDLSVSEMVDIVTNMERVGVK
ncbi:unknown [Firmicutes bacterium CAG:449]|nr:unknown [Firmicutes bacterium CAG:449]